jgi:hypothetical protein
MPALQVRGESVPFKGKIGGVVSRSGKQAQIDFERGAWLFASAISMKKLSIQF